MAERRPLDFKEALRIIIGGLRPELRNIARNFINALPEGLRKEWIGRVIGALAQLVERLEIFGIQESISDAIEIISDEIGKQVKKPKEEVRERIGVKRIEEMLAKKLEEAEKKISEAENIENEKERQKKIIEAETEIFKAYLEALSEITKSAQKEIEEKEGKKIDWGKVFNKIGGALSKIGAKIGSGIKRGYQETREAIRRTDQRAGELANRVQRLRGRVRRHGLIPRREREERQEQREE